MTITEWFFPVDDSDDPELGYALAHRTRDFRQRHADNVPRGPMRYVIGEDLVLLEGQLPMLRAFLKAYDAAPLGTPFLTCVRCGCRAVWVYGELRSTDNTGAVCDEHNCRHTTWNTRRDAECRFCGEGLQPVDDAAGLLGWVRAYDETWHCPKSPDNPALHKPKS